MVGVDLTPRVIDNPLLDRGVVADLSDLPFPDNTFDLVFSIYVLEHVSDSAPVISEIGRVLKPGGLFLSLTPNRFHYVALLSRLTPATFHTWWIARHGRAPRDTFPTFYKLNTRRALRRQFASGDFELIGFDMVEGLPGYLAFSLPTFLVGAAYERIVNAHPSLSGLRSNIIAIFRNAKEAPRGRG